jgi:hypothetical protein
MVSEQQEQQTSNSSVHPTHSTLIPHIIMASTETSNTTNTNTNTNTNTDSASNSQLSLTFIDTAWLRAFGLAPHNVMDYFAVSPFYDNTCNNQYLLMQRLPMDRLATMTGIQYVLLHPASLLTSTGELPPNHLFIIQKQLRESESKGITRTQPLLLQPPAY